VVSDSSGMELFGVRPMPLAEGMRAAVAETQRGPSRI